MGKNNHMFNEYYPQTKQFHCVCRVHAKDTTSIIIIVLVYCHQLSYIIGNLTTSLSRRKGTQLSEERDTVLIVDLSMKMRTAQIPKQNRRVLYSEVPLYTITWKVCRTCSKQSFKSSRPFCRASTAGIPVEREGSKFVG